jgi:hypothetical protein
MSDIQVLTDDAVQLIADFDAWQRRLFELQYKMTQIELVQQDEGPLCDLGWTQRELERKLDDSRKECGAQQRRVGSVLCEMIMERFQQENSTHPARGLLATASPSVKHRPTIPKKGTPEYEFVLRKMGVPDEIARYGCLQIHYEHASKYLEELGDKAPLKSNVELRVTYRKKA